ncbi:protein of unknown function [Pararobbsia alpina]
MPLHETADVGDIRAIATMRSHLGHAGCTQGQRAGGLRFISLSIEESK